MKFILVVALRSISKTKSVLVIGQKSACLLNSSQPFWDNAKATKIQLYYENHGLYNIQYNKTHKRIHIRVVPIWGTKRSVAQKQNQNHNRVFLYDQLVSESEIGGAGSSCKHAPNWTHLIITMCTTSLYQCEKERPSSHVPTRTNLI